MSGELQNDLGWLFTPEISDKLSVEDEQSFFSNPVLFQMIIESIQDGVSILDNKLNIKYINSTMKHIFSGKPDAVKAGRKCYEAYHASNTPCEGCPSLFARETKQPQTGVVCYESKNECRWHQLFAMPILDKRGDVILIIEYVRDVTFQRNLLNRLNELSGRMEIIEKKNEMLENILDQSEQNRNHLEQTISGNVERFIKPSLQYLKKTAREEDVALISGLIDEIIYPITKKRNSALKALTPRELQIAVLIKDGYTSKEIADKLYVTQKAVDYHRLNIRKKLKLNREDNLRFYLQTHL